ncbi:chromosome partitioning protein [Gammaproteobacteria bacterium ESL0073]|nr:chromosome partitioning protein [Gammaproteobacteria bacterium ESL0073]
MSKVKLSFDDETVILPLNKILTMRIIDNDTLSSVKFQTILSSIKELGIIEPIAIYPEKNGFYILLDGHLRFEALKMLNAKEAICLISTDDEGFTYNSRINRLSSIQEYRMIVTAVNKGISIEKIASVLNVNAEIIRRKLNMLDKIAPEVVLMLKNHMVAQGIFTVLRKMKEPRQIEVAKLMIAAGRISKTYADIMLAGTKPEMLMDKKEPQKNKKLNPEQIIKLQQEIEQLQENYAHAKDNIGEVMLTLVVAKGYVKKLLTNLAVNQYMTNNHKGIFEGLTAIMESIEENLDNPVMQ